MQRRSSRLLDGFIWLALVNAGCGGAARDDSASEAPVARADLPEVFASAVCDGLAPCCAARDLPFDPTKCRERAQYIDQLLTFLDDGYETYDPVAARECINSWRAAEQSCSSRAFNLADPTGVCLHVVRGTQPVGAPCNIELDCAQPAARCTGPTASDKHCEASFVTLKQGRAGDACVDSCLNPRCFAVQVTDSDVIPTGCYEADGLTCAPSHVCTPLAQAGEPCPEATCVSDATCKSGTCVPRTNSSIATPHACGTEP